jgi:hypothetical protein
MHDGRRVQLITNYWAKPIPMRKFDWQATLDGWEPGEPIGHGESEADAVYDLFMQIADREDDDEELRCRTETGA